MNLLRRLNPHEQLLLPDALIHLIKLKVALNVLHNLHYGVYVLIEDFRIL
jgi:hypothetical protein